MRISVAMPALIAFVTMVTSCVTSLTAAEIPAFPGAYGFGANTPGGRGGDVLFVTNLNDKGPGSFRAACEAEGPRTVIFRVSGTIDLDSDINIENPYLTVAGQTAPGAGITIRNQPTNHRGILRVTTHDVVLRYLRLRCRTPVRDVCCLGCLDVVSGAHHVVVDHCSMSWSVDELFSAWDGVHDVTLQWCLFSEALHENRHKEGPHSMGVLLGDERSRDFSVHHNLFAHINQRMPRIKCGGVVDVVNNVLYDWGGENEGSWGVCHVSHGARANFVGNFAAAGPSSRTTGHVVSIERDSLVYLSGNRTPRHRHRHSTEGQGTGVVRMMDRAYVSTEAFAAPDVYATNVKKAYANVVESAGAAHSLGAGGLFADRRDDIDLRVIDELKNGRGSIINSPPMIDNAKPASNGLTDSDNDGMPDDWETANKLNPHVPEDALGDADQDGYTNLEEYLNATDVHRKG